MVVTFGRHFLFSQCIASFVYIFLLQWPVNIQGGDSQSFLHKLVRFLVTLSLKILRLFRFKVLFEADIIKE